MSEEFELGYFWFENWRLSKDCFLYWQVICFSNGDGSDFVTCPEEQPSQGRLLHAPQNETATEFILANMENIPPQVWMHWRLLTYSQKWHATYWWWCTLASRTSISSFINGVICMLGKYLSLILHFEHPKVQDSLSRDQLASASKPILFNLKVQDSLSRGNLQVHPNQFCSTYC